MIDGTVVVVVVVVQSSQLPVDVVKLFEVGSEEAVQSAQLSLEVVQLLEVGSGETVQSFHVSSAAVEVAEALTGFFEVFVWEMSPSGLSTEVVQSTQVSEDEEVAEVPTASTGFFVVGEATRGAGPPDAGQTPVTVTMTVDPTEAVHACSDTASEAVDAVDVEVVQSPQVAVKVEVEMDAGLATAATASSAAGRANFESAIVVSKAPGRGGLRKVSPTQQETPEKNVICSLLSAS